MNSLLPDDGTDIQEDGVSDNNKDDITIPNWAWGIVAGGTASLAVIGTTVWHYFGKKTRQKNAEHNVKEIYAGERQDVTPREYNPDPFNNKEVI